MLSLITQETYYGNVNSISWSTQTQTQTQTHNYVFGQPYLTCYIFQLKLQSNLEHPRYITGHHMNSSEDHCFRSQGERKRSTEQNTIDGKYRQYCVPHSATNRTNCFLSFL